MALTPTTVAVNNISSLEDDPALTAAELKAKFDKTGSDLKTFINDVLIAELDTLFAGVSATEMDYLKGVTSDIQTQFTGKQKTITSGTAAPTGGADGDIYLRY